MKFATVKIGSASKVVIVVEQGKVLLLQDAAEKMELEVPNTLLACIAEGEEFLNKASAIQHWAAHTDDQTELFVEEGNFDWEAPIPRPAKNIFCVGKNYVDHALEMGSEADIPEHVMLFSKAPTSVIGHGTSIPNHEEVTNQLDYEGELAVVIGKTGKAIQKEHALDYVFGYTILNDITARDLQARHKQFLLGKSLDGSCPMGPYIVEKSEINNPNQLDIETKVNGESRQKSNTKHFIFPIEEIIEVLSKGMTLEPGDIIATGTPAGVGKGFKPPRFLTKGDCIEITIDKIGTLKNSIH